MKLLSFCLLALYSPAALARFKLTKREEAPVRITTKATWSSNQPVCNKGACGCINLDKQLWAAVSSTIWKTPYKLPAVQDIDQPNEEWCGVRLQIAHTAKPGEFVEVTIADAFDDMAFAAGSSTGLVLSRAAMTRIRTAGGLADDVAVADIMWETSSNQPTIGSKNNRCDTYAGAATAQDLLDASCPNAPIPSKPPSPDARAPSEPSIKCKEGEILDGTDCINLDKSCGLQHEDCTDAKNGFKKGQCNVNTKSDTRCGADKSQWKNCGCVSMDKTCDNGSEYFNGRCRCSEGWAEVQGSKQCYNQSQRSTCGSGPEDCSAKTGVPEGSFNTCRAKEEARQINCDSTKPSEWSSCVCREVIYSN